MVPNLSPEDVKKYAASPEVPFHGTHGKMSDHPTFRPMLAARTYVWGGGDTVVTMAPFHSIDPRRDALIHCDRVLRAQQDA